MSFTLNNVTERNTDTGAQYVKELKEQFTQTQSCSPPDDDMKCAYENFLLLKGYSNVNLIHGLTHCVTE